MEARRSDLKDFAAAENTDDNSALSISVTAIDIIWACPSYNVQSALQYAENAVATGLLPFASVAADAVILILILVAILGHGGDGEGKEERRHNGGGLHYRALRESSR